jgi:hypothetical protein
MKLRAVLKSAISCSTESLIAFVMRYTIHEHYGRIVFYVCYEHRKHSLFLKDFKLKVLVN